jgi:hypothetical protein
MLKNECVFGSSVLICLGICPNGEFLWTCWWYFGFHRGRTFLGWLCDYQILKNIEFTSVDGTELPWRRNVIRTKRKHDRNLIQTETDVGAGLGIWLNFPSVLISHYNSAQYIRSYLGSCGHCTINAQTLTMSLRQHEM